MLNSTGKQTLGTGIAFAVISILAIVLRFLANHVTKKKTGADDWFILVALAGYLAHMGAAIWGTLISFSISFICCKLILMLCV